jgi:hypothetical protein
MNEINSTDATQGQGLRARVETRKYELEAAIAKLPPGPERLDLERAIGTIEGLLTGDLEHIPSVVSAQLNQWLETNKHLAQYPASPAVDERRPVVVSSASAAAPPEKVN